MGKHLTLSSLQTILPPIKHLIDKKAESWDDLKGKPFESELKETKLIDNVSVTLTDLYGDGIPGSNLPSFNLDMGAVYSVVYDGITYKCKCSEIYDALYLGNLGLLGETPATNEPFLIFSNPWPEMVGETLDTTHTLSIIGQVETIKKIDKKFLPEIATTMVVKQAETATYATALPQATHTSKEIYEAYMAGKQVYFQYTNDSTLIPLTGVNKYNAIFIGNVIPGFGSIDIPKDAMNYQVAQYAFVIDANGFIEENPNSIETLSNLINQRVPTSRSINNRLLNSNITLTAADVGAATEEYVNNATAGIPTNLMNGDGNRSLRMRSANSASGDYSFTMGAFSEASGHAAVASGVSTKALGQGSHAEGSGTIAIGSASHAEGYESAAVGAFSHAESKNIAYGESSHAESGSGSTAATLKITGDAGAKTYTVDIENANKYLGYIIKYATGSETKFAKITSADTANNTITVSETLSSTALTEAVALIRYGASGECSHSEGRNSIASGMASHAEGNLTHAYTRMSHTEGHGTIAKGNVQHVQGEYNIIDTASKYAHIVGNGESDEARSNAHTLDWSGNAWYQGDVYVGGSGQDDTAAKKLATEEFVAAPKSSFTLVDQVTGENYVVCIRNGSLVTYKAE